MGASKWLNQFTERMLHNLRTGLDYIATAIAYAFFRPNLIRKCLEMFQNHDAERQSWRAS